MNKPQINSYLKAIKPYVPGKPVEEVERELGLSDVIKLASNENPLGPSPLAVRAMTNKINHMNVYPDGNCYYLREKIAQIFQVKPDQLVFGNGSDEIISFLALAYLSPGDETISVAPSFSEYDFATRLIGGTPVTVPLIEPMFSYNIEAILNAVTEKTKMIFICSPNNPTGTIINQKDLDFLMKNISSEILVVLDQAYFEYVSDLEHPEGLDYIREGYPVVALRTFSKIYGLAGLRIGYGIMPEAIANDLNRVREPFNVNAMAQAAALAALDDYRHIEKSRALVDYGRKQLKLGLEKLNLKPVPDQANFAFVDIGLDSREVFQALMSKGVIVRTGDIFGFPHYIRVTYGTEQQNRRFLKVLEEVIYDLT